MRVDKDSSHDQAAEDESARLDEEIDETLEDTFPASDPPSWTLGTDHQVETIVEDAKGEDDPPRS